jgi:hypothetical protein
MDCPGTGPHEGAGFGGKPLVLGQNRAVSGLRNGVFEGKIVVWEGKNVVLWLRNVVFWLK